MKKILLSLAFIASVSNYAQNNNSIDFLTGDAQIKFDISQRKVIGAINYKMNVIQNTDSVYIDARDMHIKQIKINDKVVKYNYDNKKIALYNGYNIGNNNVSIQYEAVPKKALYWVGNGTDMQIWTQGQGKNNSHWIPSFDDANEKVIFSLKVSFDKTYQIISNGKLANKTIAGNEATWTYQMNKPMSSYLLMISIGKFANKLEKSKSNTIIENYYLSQDLDKYNNTYEHTAKLFSTLEEQIGVAYPWEIYRNIPAVDFMYSGMENTTSTIFNHNFFVDKIGKNDRSFLNVNAHEMAHQWFGNLITAKNGEDHWLQEGFATYYALVAEREILGADHFYWELYQMAEKIQKDAKNNKNTKIVSEKATTTTYYDKGAWAIYYLSTQIGEVNLKKVVQNFLAEFGYKNATTQDFLNHVSAVYPSFNIEKFKTDWLYNQSFPVKDALQLINNSNWVKNYLDVVELQNTALEFKKDKLLSILKNESVGLPARKEVVYQLNKLPFAETKEFYQYVSQNKNVHLRQALIQIIDEIPSEFSEEYKKFLKDESYITQEIVLKNLWIKYPAEQHQLLNTTKQMQGMPDKNLRITWLMLALKTEGFETDKKTNYYRELENFATNKYTSDVRTNAINAMWFLNPYDSNVLPQLINGLIHQNSRFSNFCKEAIKNLSARKEFKEYFNKQIPYLPKDEHDALQNVMKNI